MKLEGNMTEQQDNHFTATVTWKQPVYPYKKPMSYLVKWFREETESQFVGLSSSVSKIGFWSIIYLYSYMSKAKLTSPSSLEMLSNSSLACTQAVGWSKKTGIRNEVTILNSRGDVWAG